MVWPKHLGSDIFSVGERLSGGKSDDISWRQGLVFIHNIIELKGMQKILVSHWKALWVTRKGSQTFLKPCMTPCECR